MNKHRLNQILEILLFPVVDVKLGTSDPLLTYYTQYTQYIDCLQDGYANASRKLSEVKDAKKELLHYLIERNAWNVKSEDEIWMLLELYYPMNQIRKEMQEIDRFCAMSERTGNIKEKMCMYYLHTLSKIANSLITYRDGWAAIRYWTERKETEEEVEDRLIFDKESDYNKVEIWNLLCRFTAPDIYIVMAAVDNHLGMEALYEQRAGIVLADKLLAQTMQKGVAENHIHFKVGYDYEILWLRRMDLRFVNGVDYSKWESKDSVRLGMGLFRYMAAVYLNSEENTDFDAWIRTKNPMVYAMVRWLYDGRYCDKLSRDAYHDILRLCRELDEGAMPRAYDHLMHRVYSRYMEYKVSSEFILLYQSYAYLRGRGRADTFFARLFIQYLRNKNKSYYEMYEQHTLYGLKFFQGKYNHAKVEAESVMGKTDQMVEIFRSQAKVRNLRKLEIRIVPKLEVSEMDANPLEYQAVRRQILPHLYDQLYEVLSAYKRYILESTLGVRETWTIICREETSQLPASKQEKIIQEIKRKSPMIPTLGIVYHFLKSEWYEDLSGYECWRNVLKWPEKHTRYKLIRRYFMSDIALAVEEIRNTIPKMSEYIVGIDAASDENATEPWMFSMAYKNMRSWKAVKPVARYQTKSNSFEHIQNIGFTYHVGEDFRHLVSGLRHVDEVIEEFGYRAGDRLGHALVLGIDVEKWADRNEVVPLPKLEYLENLLWMWGINTCEGIELPIQLEVLEDRIISLAKSIYRRSETITVKMLYSAYKKKFGMEHMQIPQKVEKDCNQDLYFFCCQVDCEKKNDETWNSDRLLATNYCPVYEERYAEKKLIKVDERDIPLFKKLQEYMIRKVETKGIYVETNPTSNLSIGEFENMDKHPIFSLNQIEGKSGHQVLVLINSDDPAVFNTNVENEFAYIYYAAQKQGISRVAILEWIEKVRRYGMEASFVRTIKSAEQIYIEIDTILREIKRIRGRR